MEDTENPPNVDEEFDHIGYRGGNLFIIDLIPEMFTVEEDAKESYFEQCLQAYGRILSLKLSANRRDWLGLVFFPTKEWDMEPETKHVLTVQKFEEIQISMLSQIMEILSCKQDYYKDMFTESEYPLHDVLWHAARSFDSVKNKMSQRQVILATCRDNPFADNEEERHKIRLRAKAFSDINVNLRILGLGKNWNHDLFYKDIEMLANNTEKEDIRRMMIDDLEVQIRLEARTMSHMEFRIGEGLHIRIIATPFSSTSKMLKAVRMCRSTNEILDVFQHFGKADYEEDSDEENEEVVTTQAPDKTRKMIRRGDEDISFGLKELREMRDPGLKGIDLLGFKDISLDLRYHIGPAKFIAVESSASDEEKELFAALLYECNKREVMAICAVHYRGGPTLAKLIPCTRFGGFYLYKIAFYEQVNDLDDCIGEFVDGGQEKSDEPIDDEGVALMKKVVKKIRINYDPSAFRNPKVSTQLACIETLALDTIADPPEDTTLPPTDIIKEKLADITNEFSEMFGSMSDGHAKRPSAAKPRQTVDKNAKYDDYQIQGLIDTGRLKDCTVPILKAMARSLGAQTVGNKAELVTAITEAFAEKQAS